MHNQHKLLRVLQLISLLRAHPPKSIRQISSVLKSTERTVYRYLSLLDAAGFAVERSDNGSFFIFSDDGSSGQLHFSAEEVGLMKRLLLTVGRDHRLKESILKKIHLHSDAEINAGTLLKAHLGKLTETILSAMHARRQLLIQKYQSVHSDKVSDRLVEPVKFTDDFRNLAAYEIASGKIKFFHIERMASVEIRKTRFQHADKHRYKIPDVFGFQETPTPFEVELILPLRAAILLREEYPMTAPLIVPEASKKKYRFKAVVYDFKPVTRFVMGFLDEIEILGGSTFKTHLQSHIGKLLRKKIGR